MTCVGTLTLRIPKLRAGSFFPDDVIERYQRVDRAIVAAVSEMYATGTSTRKVQKVAAAMGIERLSKDQVSAICDGSRATPTLAKGSRRPSRGTATTRAGGAPPRRSPRPSTPSKGSSQSPHRSIQTATALRSTGLHLNLMIAKWWSFHIHANVGEFVHNLPSGI